MASSGGDAAAAAALGAWPSSWAASRRDAIGARDEGAEEADDGDDGDAEAAAAGGTTGAHSPVSWQKSMARCELRVEVEVEVF